MESKLGFWGVDSDFEMNGLFYVVLKNDVESSFAVRLQNAEI